MRIGVFLKELPQSAGGAFTLQETILRDLMNARSKHEFIIFYPGLNNFILNSTIQSIPLDTVIDNKIYHKTLLQAVHEYEIDIVWFVSLCFENIDIPFIVPVWDLHHRLQPYFPEVSTTGWDWDSRESFYRYVLPRATYVITGTKAGGDEIAKFYNIPYERIKKIPHPTPSFALEYFKLTHTEAFKVDSNLTSKYSGIFSNNREFLLYPAQFWPHKNHISILLALKILKEQHALNFSVVFTGSDQGNKKYILEKALEFQLTDNVYFLGLVSYELLLWLYRKAFALIYPSFFGPENLPPLEAFALGCPVIASRVSGAEEQLGDAAILIDPKNELEIALSIKKLFLNPDLRQTLIKRGLERTQTLQNNTYMNNMISIFDEFASIRRCWSSKEIYQHP